MPHSSPRFQIGINHVISRLRQAVAEFTQRVVQDCSATAMARQNSPKDVERATMHGDLHETGQERDQFVQGPIPLRNPCYLTPQASEQLTSIHQLTTYYICSP